MASFDVPKVALIELGDGSRLPVRIDGIAPTGLWVVVADRIPASFRSKVRVSFPGLDGALGVITEIVQASGNGLGLELVSGEDDLSRKVFEDWSKGRTATLHLGSISNRRAIVVRKEPPKPAHVPQEREAMRRRWRRKMLDGMHVLIVEDDSGVARLLQTGLARCGGHPHVAPDGMAALDIATSKHVDAVLLDWMLPTMGGARVLGELRKMHPNLPVAVVSGMVHSATMRSEVRKLGADEVFPKPFELARITDWIMRKIQLNPHA
jgi:CheY-like chemotaxis protein